MELLPDKPAVLLLQDGTAYSGKAAGAIGTATGEIAFNTGMTGYQEIFTDPSYFGQILVMAAAHIGNYGTHDEEIESQAIKIAGLVVKNFSENFSRRGASNSLQHYFERDGKVAIRDVDTRALIRHIRDKGAMNAIISSETTDLEALRAQLQKVPSMEGLELSSKVSCTEAYEIGPTDSHRRIAVLDLGAKRNIVKCLLQRGACCKVFPLHSSLDDIQAWNPSGYLISNGPGDPSAMPQTVNLVKELVQSGLPLFGICLGHQVLALSQGLKTVKMFNGHRGINHPVKNLLTGKGEITSQNHGFVVDMASAKNADHVEITHIHLNDDSLAGLRLRDRPVFSVQYHPEASPGPHDSRYLFDQFLATVDQYSTQLTHN